MIRVERVAGAAVIGVAGAVLFENVVGAVLQPAEAQRRPVVVAFGGVIENNIENDFDARPVQRLHHVAKFVYRAERILARAVALVRREERDRRIAPVIMCPGGASCASNWNTGSSSTAVMPSCWR